MTFKITFSKIHYTFGKRKSKSLFSFVTFVVKRKTPQIPILIHGKSLLVKKSTRPHRNFIHIQVILSP
jgi:hypothetical protein